MTVQICWHGHATLSLEVDGVKVVVDPFFAPRNPVAKTTVDEVAADFVLITHGHGDHVADAVTLLKQTGATAIVKPEIGNWLEAQGVEKTHGMNAGGSFDFPFGRLTMTTAFHSSGLPDGSYGGEPGGFVIDGGGRRIYIAGDTDVFSDMALIARGGLDLAVLPIGDNFTMGPDSSLLALEFLKPKAVIPYHYNTWPRIAVDVDDWVAKVRETTDVRPIVAGVDEPVEL